MATYVKEISLSTINELLSLKSFNSKQAMKAGRCIC